MGHNPLSGVLNALRRSWYLVVLTAGVGAAVALALTTTGGVQHTGVARIAVDELALGRLRTIANSETVLRALQKPAFAERVAEAAGEDDVDSVRSSLRSYSVGLPPQEIRIAYTARERDVARRMAEVAGAAAMEEITRLNSVERDRQSVIAEEAAIILETIGRVAADSADVDPVNAVLGSWGVRNSQLAAEYQIALLDAAYVLLPEVSTQPETAERKAVENAIGGGVLGLVLGAGIALGRARWMPAG